MQGGGGETPDEDVRAGHGKRTGKGKLAGVNGFVGRDRRAGDKQTNP